MTDAVPRVAIVGTAPSWRLVPWTDPSLQIWSLNDAYRLAGFLRADRWFDLHPLDKFMSVPEKQTVIAAHQIPVGHYVRPADHLAWLGRQQIPVYLNPDHRTQYPPSADWPHARVFPKAEIEALFGRYFMSSPAWMLALALAEGVRDVTIYGIHLATEFEYIQQRPNFEFLIGCILGRGPIRQTTTDGVRHFETADGHVALPEASPLLQGGFQYAFEPRPDAVLEPIKWELQKLQIKRGRKLDALRRRPWYRPWAVEAVPQDGNPLLARWRVWASTLQQELLDLDAAFTDREQELQRYHAGGLI